MQIPKSRYDSVDLYISESWMNRPEYNDNPLPIDQALYDRMRKHGEPPVVPAIVCYSTVDAGIDDLLSKHIAHLFIRDPIVIFSELIDQDDSESTDHFEVCSFLAFFFGQVLTSPRAEHPIHQLADS
jgi:glutamate--cysteine ligase catalytic subunit